VERRYAVFIAISLAAILTSQFLQAWLFPRPARQEQPPEAVVEQADADASPPAPEPRGFADTRPLAAADPASPAVQAAPAAARTRLTLGSLAADEPSGMLVTLTSRGAAVERIELVGSRFHDQDDRGGYIGHLAGTAVERGCRVGIVGRGTPAALAGLAVGDIIVRVDGKATPDPRSLAAVLAAVRPGSALAVEVLRGGEADTGSAGESLTLEMRATRRPLEVVRPEFDARPVIDPEAGPADPLSFRMSLESRDDRRRGDLSAEISGEELDGVDWEAEQSEEDGVRFSRQLPGGLRVVKEYRLVKENGGEGVSPQYRLLLTLRFESATPTRLAYALDGPSGLPTEGWWYAARISRTWGSLAVRDVAMRFLGEPTSLVSGLSLAAGDLDHPSSAVLEEKPLAFAGVDALYFASGLVPAVDGPERPRLAEVRPIVVGDVPEAARRKLVNVSCRLVSREFAVEPEKPVAHRYEIFAGPKQPEVLAAFGRPKATMDDLVYYGWFGWVARPMIAVLHVLHRIVGNYGIAIILLTVLVRGAMFPISRKQALASQKMQVLQPEMKAISEKYKNDPEKRTRATQELWRKHNYNPAGGCLLVFIQIPIFMGLYRSLATDVELRQAALFSPVIRWCSNLAAPDMFLEWSGFMPAFLVTPEGWLGPYLNLFPLATIGLFLWQQHLFMPPAVDEQAKMQQQVMKYMMFFMALMFFKVPCGLCLYFIASSLWGIAERLLLPTTPAAAGPGGVTVIDAVSRPTVVAAGQKRRRKR
jgi:YidC/Oxa1 family membrane protein insertase